jgi:hypothetical protein
MMKDQPAIAANILEYRYRTWCGSEIAKANHGEKTEGHDCTKDHIVRMEVELRVRASGILGVEYALRRSSPRASASFVSRAVSWVAAVLTTAGWVLALAAALVSWRNGQTTVAVAAAALAAVLAATSLVSGRAVVEGARC